MNSLINSAHAGSRAWPCPAVSSAQTPVAAALPELFIARYFCALAGQGRDKGLIECVWERIW